MRLWHEKLLEVLPDKQLLSQHRECCALRGKGWGKKHSTVDYVFTHSQTKLVAYHWRVMQEMEKRQMKPKVCWFNPSYRGTELGLGPVVIPGVMIQEMGLVVIYPEHNMEYLMECLDNLIEKLRVKLNKSCTNYGLEDLRTIKVSQELDKLITTHHKASRPSNIIKPPIPIQYKRA